MALTKEETERVFDLYYNFDKRVKGILELKQMSPVELADKMDIPRSNIYRFISKGRHPDMLNLMKMADAFDISVDELIGLKELEV